MTTDPAGQRDAPPPPAPPRGATPGGRLQRAAIIAVTVALLALGAYLGRHAIFGVLLTRSLGIVTGDRVTIDDFRIGLQRSVFRGVHVRSPGGDPVLSARAVTLFVSLPALLTDRVHRYGVLGVEADGLELTVVRHADGSYNLGRGTGGGASGSAGGTSDTGVPWNLTVRVRDGMVRLLDEGAVAPDLHAQQVTIERLDASLHSTSRSIVDAHAAYVGRRAAGAPERRWPLVVGGTVDFSRGIAAIRVRAAQLPLRGLVSFLQHSPAVRVDDGLLDGVAVTVFGLGIRADRPLALHLGGSADLVGGRLEIGALRRPVRDARGHVVLLDDGIWTTRLEGSLAGIPVVARGGGYDRFHPTLRLGIRGDGDLHDLRSAFTFSRAQPIRGAAHVETLIEAPTASLLVRSAVRVSRGWYNTIPLREVQGRVDYHAGAVVLDAVRGRYGPAEVEVGARFLLGPPLDAAIVAVANAPAGAIPYGENLAPDARAQLVSVIAGGQRGYTARGALALRGPITHGAGTFAIDERGRGEFGPFAFARADGSALDGALRLERPSSRSAAWLTARNFRVAVPSRGATFPGLRVPAFPPLAGRLNGTVIGGGSPDAFAVAGDLQGADVAVRAIRLGTARARVAGTLADLQLSALRVRGPLGRFGGTAGIAGGTFALRGRYDGALERLEPFTGPQQSRGAVSGDVEVAFDGRDVLVGSPGAVLRAASVRGVAVQAAAGTLAIERQRLRVIAASGTIGGRRAVAAESGGKVAVSAPDLPSSALRGAGIPLEAGNVSAYGLADLRRRDPGFEGTVAVAGGRARGYPVNGDAQIALVDRRARVAAATGALGSTFGSIGGVVDGVGGSALRYDLDARVPLGDIDVLRRDLRLPVAHLAGSFSARLHVHGSGANPSVDGRIEAPEGSYNGLAFRGGTHLALDPHGIVAREGSLTVGSTTTAFAASLVDGAIGFQARSVAANVADFNDYFDASDTLAGHGAFDLAFRDGRTGLSSRGDVRVAAMRYRTLPLGDVAAHWTTHGQTIAGTASVRSAGAGSLAATLSVVPAPGPLAASLRGATYAVQATLADVDLPTWIAALGRELPVTGRADARLAVRGRFPDLAANLDATLRDGIVDGIALTSAHLAATSLGSRISIRSGEADFGFARLAASGTLGMAPTDPLAFDIRATSDDLGAAVRRFPLTRGLDVAGALDSDVRVTGTRALPQVTGGFELRGARYGSVTVPRVIGAVAKTGNALEVRDADVEFTRGQAFVAGSLPLTLRPLGLGPPRAPLSFDVTARGVDLAQFAPLLPTGTSIGGTLDGRFGVEGSVDRPRLFGNLSIAGGSYTSPFERAPIQALGADLQFSGSTVALRTFHANVGGGTLDGSGHLRLPIDGLGGVRYDAALRATAAKLDFPAYGRGILDGSATLAGSGWTPHLAGELTVRNAIIPVSAVYGAGGAATGEGVAAGSGSWRRLLDPSFGLRVIAGDDVRLRSGIVDIGVKGAVDVSGTLHRPALAGAFAATDGTISSYNHIFKIQQAAVTFNPADGITPTVTARASARVTNPDPDPARNIAGNATIFVNVSGTADANNLQVTYSSEPVYTQEQIVGLLLDVPALLGAVSFNLNGGLSAPILRGAPGETNALLPPGVTPEQVTAVSFNQEVFSLLNGQFTQRALTPAERFFERTLGLSDVQFTVDYGGGIGYSLRRQIGRRDFYAFLSQTVTYPQRVLVGFELQPKPFETINFSFYSQDGITSLITNATPGEQEYVGATRRLIAVQPLGNRAGLSINYSRRF